MVRFLERKEREGTLSVAQQAALQSAVVSATPTANISSATATELTVQQTKAAAAPAVAAAAAAVAVAATSELQLCAVRLLDHYSARLTPSPVLPVRHERLPLRHSVQTAQRPNASLAITSETIEGESSVWPEQPQ